MPRPRRLSRTVVSDDDLELLKFLWKWRTSTTSALSQKFYPHKNKRRGYERLRALETGGLIESRADSRAQKFIWVLSKRGFATVRPYLPLLKDEGFRSAALGHDLMSAALMLGDWLTSPQPGVRLISEQQLLRYEEPIAKISQPYGTSHRTDGYWFYPEKKELIALEIQLTHQRQEFYDHLQAFYSQKENHHIRHVLWCVATPGMKDSIRRQLGKRVDQGRHHFVSFRSFFQLGWAAQLEDGPLLGTSIQKLLSGYLPADSGPAGSPESIAPHQCHRLLLDVRKSPHAAKNELFYEPLDMWMA